MTDDELMITLEKVRVQAYEDGAAYTLTNSEMITAMKEKLGNHIVLS